MSEITKAQVRRFYDELWNAHDTSSVSSVPHEAVTFRGSLGEDKVGHDGFAAYVDRVHHALGEYRCLEEQVVAEEDRVFAKMLFTSVHRNEFMGFAPTGHRVEWHGCAVFTFEGRLIRDVWVLGDLKNLELQLQHNAS